MTVNSILDLARDMTHTTAAQFSNTKLIVWANIVYQDLVNKICNEVAENYFTFFQEIDAITTGTGGYAYDTSMNKLKVVKIKPTSTATEWVVSTEIDFSKQANDIAWFMVNQSISNPVHQIIGESIFIAPQFVTANTGGVGNKQIYIQFEDSPAELAVNGAESTVKLPLSQHNVIAFGLAPMIQASNGKKNHEQVDQAKYNNRVDVMIASMNGRDDTGMFIRTPSTTNLE